MHFIFLGPGETGSWDAALFWTQLLLAGAAVGSPFIAHILANGRELRASQDADCRLERANEQAMERERKAHENAEARIARQRKEQSDSIFHAVQSEAKEIQGQLVQLRERWPSTKRVSAGRGEEMAIQVTPLLSDPSVWSNLTDRAQLDATVSLLGRIRDYNAMIGHIWKTHNQIINRQLRDAIDAHLSEIDGALRAVLRSRP